jgi:3-hydroxyisobutyrate dehydrogenase-like beta-hydroxyacid dehydrogenase
MACRSVLRQKAVEAAIAGTLVVQLTTSTPADARDEAEWAGDCGARYLGGAILAAPVMVGTARARAFYSGVEEVFTQYLPLLQVLAPNSTYCGHNIGGAATIDHALLEVSYGCQAVLFHAMALCEAGSIPLPFFLSQLTLFADGFLEQRAGAIGSGTYPSGTATMHTFRSWAEQLVRTAEDAGVDATLPVTLLRSITKTVELGHGDDDYQALYEAFRREG